MNVTLRVQEDRLTAFDQFARSNGMTRTACILLAMERLLKKGL